MKKRKAPAKLRLSRETLRLLELEARTLDNVAGRGGGAVEPGERLTGDTCLCMTYDPCNP